MGSYTLKQEQEKVKQQVNKKQHNKQSVNKKNNQVANSKNKKNNKVELNKKRRNPRNKNFVKKYRKTIVEAMDPKFVEIFGFDKSYFVFERSINRMSKEGDLAEELALQHLKDEGLLGAEYRTNQIITLRNIKMEADVIDYDNKIVYETKSRKNRDVAKKACKEKWRWFEFEKNQSRYHDFKFKGIVVENQEDGPKVIGISSFPKATVDPAKMQLKVDKYFETLAELKAIKYNPERAKAHFRNKKQKK